MKIHDYAPGNGTLYRVGLDSTDYNHMILVWLNPHGREGGLCVDLGSYPHVNYDVLQRQLGIESLADVAAILGWLKKTFGFSGYMPSGFNDTGARHG